jgi:hypothetical protein
MASCLCRLQLSMNDVLHHEKSGCDCPTGRHDLYVNAYRQETPELEAGDCVS